MPAAAGGTNLPEVFPHGDSEFYIICKHLPLGYLIYLESEIPRELIIVFYKDDVELYRKKISNEVPEELTKAEEIKGWTYIQICRKENTLES